MSMFALTLAAPLLFAGGVLIFSLVKNRPRPKAIETKESTMTKKVKIENADTYPADLLVTCIAPATGEPIATSGAPVRVRPGESVEAWVHGSQSLRIDEVAQEIGATTQGGGGPGEPD